MLSLVYMYEGKGTRTRVVKEGSCGGQIPKPSTITQGLRDGGMTGLRMDLN